VFLARDIDNILITNEIVGERKLHRLSQLAWRYPDARIGVCVDDASVTHRLGALCVAQEARLDVYVELDVGQNRCGVTTSAEAVELHVPSSPVRALRSWACTRTQAAHNTGAACRSGAPRSGGGAQGQ